MRRILNALFGLSLVAGSAAAQDADGWRPARPDDFVDTPWSEARAARPGMALSASGDFDGNGVRDAAWLTVNTRLGLYAVEADLRGRTGFVRLRLASAPLHALGVAGLEVAPGRPDTLVIFSFGGARQFVRFHAGRVTTRWD